MIVMVNQTVVGLCQSSVGVIVSDQQNVGR